MGSCLLPPTTLPLVLRRMGLMLLLLLLFSSAHKEEMDLVEVESVLPNFCVRSDNWSFSFLVIVKPVAGGVTGVPNRSKMVTVTCFVACDTVDNVGTG